MSQGPSVNRCQHILEALRNSWRWRLPSCRSQHLVGLAWVLENWSFIKVDPWEYKLCNLFGSLSGKPTKVEDMHPLWPSISAPQNVACRILPTDAHGDVIETLPSSVVRNCINMRMNYDMLIPWPIQQRRCLYENDMYQRAFISQKMLLLISASSKEYNMMVFCKF